MLCPSGNGQPSKMLIKITNLSDEVAYIGGTLFISRISTTKLTPFMLLHSYRVTTEQKKSKPNSYPVFPQQSFDPSKGDIPEILYSPAGTWFCY